LKKHDNCIRCGRKLKTEASQELGFGKVCWEKFLAEDNMKRLFKMEKTNENTN
jgi:hypothetical protein